MCGVAGYARCGGGVHVYFVHACGVMECVCVM